MDKKTNKQKKNIMITDWQQSWAGRERMFLKGQAVLLGGKHIDSLLERLQF